MAAPKGPIDRDELALAVSRGASIAEIAEAFERSKPTVRYWMKRYGLVSLNGAGRRRPRRRDVRSRSAA